MRIFAGTVASLYLSILVDGFFVYYPLGLVFTVVVGILKGMSNNKFTLIFHVINYFILLVGSIFLFLFFRSRLALSSERVPDHHCGRDNNSLPNSSLPRVFPDQQLGALASGGVGSLVHSSLSQACLLRQEILPHVKARSRSSL